MLDPKIEQLYIIRDEMLTSPTVESRYVWLAAELADEDDYLNTLMLDWMKTTNQNLKDLYLEELVDYTSEYLRKLTENV